MRWVLVSSDRRKRHGRGYRPALSSEWFEELVQRIKHKTDIVETLLRNRAGSRLTTSSLELGIQMGAKSPSHLLRDERPKIAL
jgi:hypothetical protein